MNDFDEEDVGIGYRDLLMGVVGLFAMLILAISLWVNDPKQKADGQPPPGDLVVSIFWPEGPIDVDLWLDGPGEPNLVGFSNKSGVIWNLLRDDLGISNDIVPLIFENAYSRGSPAGRYTVNLFCFSCSGPVPVKVKVEKKDKSSGILITIWEGEVVLSGYKDEKTAVSFVLDDDAKVIDLDNVQRKFFN